MLRINAPCPAPQRNHREPDSLGVSVFTLFLLLFIAPRIPPSIAPGLKPLLRGGGAQSILASAGDGGPKIAEPEDGPLRIVSIQPHNSTAARVARSPLYTGGQEIQRAKVGGRSSQPSPSSLHQAIPPIIVILKQMNNYGSQHL